MVMTAVRERCGREQAEARDKAMKWGESPAMRFLFGQVDRLELASDEALGIEGGGEIATALSRARDELIGLAETERETAVRAAVDSCEFVDDESDPGVGWHGKDAEEQQLDYQDELERDLPTVDDMARRARREGWGRPE